VNLDVLLQVRGSRELLAAVFAFKWFFSEMNFNMAA
jgi:hypothetical protein